MLFLFGPVLGCGVEPGEVPVSVHQTDEGSTINIKTTFPSNFAPAEGAIIVDNGHQWVVHKVVPRAVDFNTVDALPIQRSTAPSSDALSDAEIADRMRPIVLSADANGDVWQYERLTPDIARVTQARAKQAAQLRMRVNPDGTIDEGVTLPPLKSLDLAINTPSYLPNRLLPYSTYIAEGLEPSWLDRDHFGVKAVGVGLSPLPTRWEPRNVFYNPYDDRAWVTPTTRNSSSAYKAQVSFKNPLCSGTMIGTYTAISAAHCFWQLPAKGGPQPSGAAYPNDHLWALGAISRVQYVGGLPVVDDTTFAYPSTGRTSSCITITFPSGFVSTLGAVSEDFAVVDFHGGGCTASPGLVTGWLSAGIGTAADHNLAQSWLAAYDSATPLPNNYIAPWTYLKPSLLERYYPLSYSAQYYSTSELVSYVIDLTGGASGGGLLQRIFSQAGDPTWYWVGPSVYESVSQLFNGFRNLDWNMWFWIRDNSSEFP